MNIRTYEPKDYALMKKWWLDRSELFPAEDMVPPTTFVAELDGKPVAMRSVLMTNFRFAMLENNCADPEASSETRFNAIEAILQSIYSLCKRAGLDHVISFPIVDGVAKSSERHGFTIYKDKCFFVLRRI